jgi:nucleoside-diphosphate-sugar epimerase
MKIFITGRTGYIGNAVAKESATAGNHVLGLVRDSVKSGRLIQIGIQPVPGETDKSNTFRNIAALANVVVLAALNCSDDSGDQLSRQLRIPLFDQDPSLKAGCLPAGAAV